MFSYYLNKLKLLLGPILLFLFSMLIFSYPIIAALILGPIILFISLIWGGMIIRFQRFQSQNINVTGFEQKVYSNGAPNFSNIRVYINKNFKGNSF